MASAASNWLDDFYDWSVFGYDEDGVPGAGNGCCFINVTTGGFCPSKQGNGKAALGEGGPPKSGAGARTSAGDGSATPA